MSNQNDGGHAFPAGEYYVTHDLAGNRADHAKSPWQSGMSLRDCFAAHALTGLLIHDLPPSSIGASLEQVAAIAAYDYADAMLAERERKDGDT